MTCLKLVGVFGAHEGKKDTGFCGVRLLLAPVEVRSWKRALHSAVRVLNDECAISLWPIGLA